MIIYTSYTSVYKSERYWNIWKQKESDKYLFEVIDLQNMLILHRYQLIDVPLLIATPLIERWWTDLEPSNYKILQIIIRKC